MSDIHVKCIDQSLQITNAPLIASGGVNEDYVIFDFDSSWDGYGKNAVFYHSDNRADVYESAINSAGTAPIPHEVMEKEGKVFFGVVGVRGIIVRTSEVLWYQIREGASTYGHESVPPTPDIYQQMLSLAGEIETRQEEWEDHAEEVIQEIEQASGRLVIFSGLASSVTKDSTGSRIVHFPGNVKLGDFDSVTIYLKNLGHPTAQTGGTGTSRIGLYAGSVGSQMLSMTTRSCSDTDDLGSAIISFDGSRSFNAGEENKSTIRYAFNNKYVLNGVQYEQEDKFLSYNSQLLYNVNTVSLLVSDNTSITIVGYNGNSNASGNIVLPATTNLLKGDGEGGAAVASPGTDYLTPDDVPAAYVSGSTLYIEAAEAVPAPASDYDAVIQTTMGTEFSDYTATFVDGSFADLREKLLSAEAQSVKILVMYQGYYGQHIVKGKIECCPMLLDSSIPVITFMHGFTFYFTFRLCYSVEADGIYIDPIRYMEN